MKKTTLTYLAASVLGMSSPAALSAEKHVHGEAELYVVFNQGEMTVEFISPAANIVGFEHPPHDAEEKALVAKAETTLETIENVLVLNGGKCSVEHAHVELERESENDHHDHHDHHEEEADESQHSEFHAEYELKCQSMKDITEITVTVFDAYPAIESLDVNWISESQQGGFETNSKKRTVTIKH